MKHININNPELDDRLQKLETKLNKLKLQKRELIKPINKQIASVTQMIYREEKKINR